MRCTVEEAQHRCTSAEFAEWIDRWTEQAAPEPPDPAVVRTKLQAAGIKFVKAGADGL